MMYWRSNARTASLSLRPSACRLVSMASHPFEICFSRPWSLRVFVRSLLHELRVLGLIPLAGHRSLVAGATCMPITRKPSFPSGVAYFQGFLGVLRAETVCGFFHSLLIVRNSARFLLNLRNTETLRSTDKAPHTDPPLRVPRSSPMARLRLMVCGFR